MSLIVLIDSGPLGLATNPNATQDSLACKEWISNLPLAGHLPLVPAVIDYEPHRELQLMNRQRALQTLNRLKQLGYLPLTGDALLKDADFWAVARRGGMPAADRLALDADVILAGQAATLDPSALEMTGAAVVVATENLGTCLASWARGAGRTSPESHSRSSIGNLSLAEGVLT